MDKLAKQIEEFLLRKGHVISVTCNGNRLEKNASNMRFAFTGDDIVNEYGSVSDLLKSLPEKGFTEKVTISFRKVYGSGKALTYHEIKKITINIKQKEEMNSLEEKGRANTHRASASVPNYGLGYTPVSNEDWLQSKVKETRYNDIERELNRVQEELLDVKSKLRIKEEEYATLRIKYETEQERSELKLERDRLERKGFFESPAFEKAIEGLGAMLPAFLPKQEGQALGMPDESSLSELKKSLITYIKSEDCTDEQAGVLGHILNNYNEQLVQTVMGLIGGDK